MNDRELLEAAAKAAGIKYTKPTSEYSGAYGLAVEDEHGRIVRDWNPLQDDGDALRLAVRCRIDLVLSSEDNLSAYCRVLKDFVEEPRTADPASATRRAIVRAAAALGGAK